LSFNEAMVTLAIIIFYSLNLTHKTATLCSRFILFTLDFVVAF
jgi:hypothetical protein